MNSGGGPAVPGIDYTMILTRNDELVNPYTSGIMEGADNFIVQDQCETDQSEHLSIIFDPITAYDIFNALNPGEDAEVPLHRSCSPASAPPATPATEANPRPRPAPMIAA